ncbi:BUD32 protein kinase [Aphanomyces astaci]|uniref:non-specific serine/threonine protein kinase n=1 Tax=Aphanomyces astaci TaxID=112090 RepID=W4FZ43_APHAT|nr:BUD32 protein kinase [Aphanomyces astaci]ETV71953.1 BUD32 protein kinase [Aphanomyces astaci]|eukprot:XP_009838396.1 BUD32 protein kinase [Aphanomyces astaci]
MATAAKKSSWEVLSQGAEAIVYATDFAGRPCVIKERVVKTYRLRQLDKKLSHRRLVQEARCNFKCRKAGVDTPCIFLIDEAKGRLYMERIQGMSAKQYLYDSYNATTQQYATDALAVCYQIGVAIARMHDADIVHGDLTTSNLMKKDSLSTITVIDFGLANSQPLPEDKAVDLYVMERAFQSTHVHSEPLVAEILRAYKAKSRRSDATFHKLYQVRSRGRKRTMVG